MRTDELMRRTTVGSRRKRTVGDIVAGVVLILGAVITAFPFVWMVFAAFKPRSESVAIPPRLLPQNPTTEYFERLFVELDFALYLRNTVGVVLISFVGLFLTAMAGYAFAKFDFRGKKVLFFLVLTTMMIPAQVTMIPTYLILHRLSLINTLLGMAAPTLVTAFGVFLFRQFMTTIPSDMLEAARVDGAGELRIFFQIVMPNAKPIFAVQGVLTFIAGWNSFLWPLIVASDDRLYTLSVGVALLNQQIATNPGLQMAAATVMVAPIVVVFIFLQRNIIQGFTMSGIK